MNLAARVAARLTTLIEPGQRVLVGLSGGIDSIVLLDVLARLAKRRGFLLEALHVNHQMSPNAARWARFCRNYAREREIACRVAKVKVRRGNSAERAAREARYAAFHEADADYIALAHHADDQAETVLLQLFRGAGVKGLAAMPFCRVPSASSPRASILRPLLDVTRAEIEDYARRHRLKWIEDESNADTAYLRNWLRHELAPCIASRVPGYRATLTRAARHFGEAAGLLDDLACADSGEAIEQGRIEIARLRRLSNARAKNVLRFLLDAGGWPMPQADCLDEALRQIMTARKDARLRIDLGSCELRQHGAVLQFVPGADPPADRAVVTWLGERELALEAWGGILAMHPRRGAGISIRRLLSEPVTIRLRRGGERLQPDFNRPRRTVKNLLQEARVPAWERERVPFIYCGDTLVCVPGVGIEHRFQALAGEASILPDWRRLAP